MASENIVDISCYYEMYPISQGMWIMWYKEMWDILWHFYQGDKLNSGYLYGFHKNEDLYS